MLSPGKFSESPNTSLLDVVPLYQEVGGVVQEQLREVPVTFAEVLIEPVCSLLSTCENGEQLLEINHPDILWGRILITMYEELLSLLSPSERVQATALFSTTDLPDYLGIVALLTTHSDYYPFLLFRLGRRLSDWVDCPSEKHDELQMFLFRSAAILLMNRGSESGGLDGRV
jgi:hypothetical protein